MGLEAIIWVVCAFAVLEIGSYFRRHCFFRFNVHPDGLKRYKQKQIILSMSRSGHLKNAGIVLILGLTIFWLQIPKTVSNALFGPQLESSLKAALAATAGLLALLTFSANRLASWQEWLDHQGGSEESDSYLGYSVQATRFNLSANRYLATKGFRSAVVGIFISVFAVGVFSFYPVDWKLDGCSYSLLYISLKVWLISYGCSLLALIANLLSSFRLMENIEVKARIADRVFKDNLSRFNDSRNSKSRYICIREHIRLKLKQVCLFPTAHEREIGIAICGLPRDFECQFLNRNILRVIFYFDAEDERALKAVRKYQKLVSRAGASDSNASKNSRVSYKVFTCIERLFQEARRRYLLNKISAFEMLYSGIVYGSIQFLKTMKDADDDSVIPSILELISYHAGRLDNICEQINELVELLENEEITRILLFTPRQVFPFSHKSIDMHNGEKERLQLRAWVLIEDFLSYYSLPSLVKEALYDTEVVRNLAESAQNLRHEDTRNSALAAVMSLACRQIRNTKDSRGLSTDFFNQYAVIAMHKTSNWPNQKLLENSDEQLPQITKILQDCAYRTLTEAGSSLSPFQTSILLTCVSTWRPYSALLRNLLYERRSGRRLKADIIEAYWKYFNDFQHFALTQDGVTFSEDKVVDEMRSSYNNVSHFGTRKGIYWLVHSLQKPLDIDMLSDFIDKRSDACIEELDALDFILWHCAATLKPSPFYLSSQRFIQVIEQTIKRLSSGVKSTDSNLKIILDDTKSKLNDFAFHD